VNYMSRLIDADKLKDAIAKKYVNKSRQWYVEAIEAMNTVDEQPTVLLSCPKCHGTGEYGVPKFDDETYMPSMTEWENRPCEICHKTGKISIDDYEMLQSAIRGEK